MTSPQYPILGSYDLPKKNVFVLSCIDLRFSDSLSKFLDHDKLTNRYDHFILAGTSLGTQGAGVLESLFNDKVMEKYNSFSEWKMLFCQHLDLAVNLHQVEDVYIMEHEDCGAYKGFLKDGIFTEREKEHKCHKHFASQLAKDIQEKTFTRTKPDGTKEDYKLNVHCFILDLRGNVDLLYTTTRKTNETENCYAKQPSN
ncbi:hypothetical protein [Litoribacter populi]|uniref:hypothetical protein n=1 Tax=Litoribacter populi TaxID=2598460 RepID=UPI00117E6E93|nr:hypothetical protein [Litoribacter populi]